MDVFVEIPNQTFEAEIRRKDIWDTSRTALELGDFTKKLNFQLFLFSGPEERGLIMSSERKFETFICNYCSS